MTKNWIPVSFEFDKELKNALGQQHLAAQLIALVGRYLVPKKPDLSNINMQFIPDKEILAGNKLENEYKIGLHLTKLEIQLLDSENNILHIIQLNNKTFEKAFEELKQLLVKEGIDISELKTEQPYDLSTNSLMDGKFSTQNKTSFQNGSILRHNANVVISELATQFVNSIPVRIWPHHFDTGTYFSTAKNSKGEDSQTIGMGWALPDKIVNEPYFYLSFWSAKEFNKPGEFNPLPIGEWMIPEWNGAVLQHSQILNGSSTDKQYNQIKEFYNIGIEQITQFFQINKK